MKKIIFLFFLAVASTINAGVESADLDDKLYLLDLNDAQLAKLEELTEMGKKIDEEYKVYESMDEHIKAIFYSTIETRWKASGLKPEEYDFSDLQDEVYNFCVEFEKAFTEKKDVRGFFCSEFTSDKEVYAFNFAKFLMIKRHFQQMLIIELRRRYEKKLQEFIEIAN